MRLYPPIQFLLAAALAMMFVVPMSAQTSDPAPVQENPPKESSRKQEKARLEEVTRVSTEKAAQSAAKEKSKPGTEEKSKGPELSGGSQVTEFHPAIAEERAPAGEPGATRTKCRAKDIHGSVQGAGGSRGSGAAGGGEVGATTKSGKTSVYVQSEKSRTANPNPH